MLSNIFPYFNNDVKDIGESKLSGLKERNVGGNCWSEFFVVDKKLLSEKLENKNPFYLVLLWE